MLYMYYNKFSDIGKGQYHKIAVTRKTNTEMMFLDNEKRKVDQ